MQRAKQIVEDYDCKHHGGLQRKESGEVKDKNGEIPMQCALLHSNTSSTPLTTGYTRRQYKRAVEVLRVLV